MKMIYLASPYSHIKESIMNKRENTINLIAAGLHVKYEHLFFLPITQSAPLERHRPELGGSFSKWRKRDLEAIRRSDELWVVMLEGWDTSIGVTAEIKYAKRTKKPIYYIDPMIVPLQPRILSDIPSYVSTGI
jgi:nucleoside 2-deoxyribosyltransferase